MSDAHHGTVTAGMLRTATVSLAGTLVATATVDLALDGYMFWPMFHTTGSLSGVMLGHSVDGADPDLARCALGNTSGSSITYDFDYRYIT